MIRHYSGESKERMKPAGNKKAVAKTVAPKELNSEITELKALVEFLKQNEVAEFDLDRGDFKVRLKFSQPESAQSASPSLAELARFITASSAAAPVVPTAAAAQLAVVAAPAAASAAPVAAADPDAGLHIVKSPIVGTFYESPSPGASAFVVIGDKVEKGQVICIVEAMKLMNEIESDASGEIVKRLVSNGQPIEFGQPLFAIRVG
jgi:acetyl-CoA carboxylase biotin carboxyl carrier protein